MQLLSYEQGTWLVRNDPTAVLDPESIERGASQPNIRKGDQGIAVRTKGRERHYRYYGCPAERRNGKGSIVLEEVVY